MRRMPGSGAVRVSALLLTCLFLYPGEMEGSEGTVSGGDRAEGVEAAYGYAADSVWPSELQSFFAAAVKGLRRCTVMQRIPSGRLSCRAFLRWRWRAMLR